MKYKIRKAISSESEALTYFYLNKSVYFVPLGRVMPCRFFMSWSWMSSEKFLQHVKNGHFVECKSYSDISRERIRNILSEMRVN